MLRTNKRLLASLATFSLVETIGRHPAIAGILMLLGVGGGAGIANLMTPTLTPFIASNFNPNQTIGATNNGLKPNGGTNGATQFPTTPTNSTAFYFEATVDPSLAYGQGLTVPFFNAVLQTNTFPGQPNLYFQRLVAGIQGSQWWLGTGSAEGVNGSASTGSNYATGLYPFTVPTSIVNCGSAPNRQPTGVWYGGQANFQQVDPGFGCPSTTTPTLNAAAIAANVPGSGAQQATGLAASLGATTCVSNAPVAGEMKVTVNLAVAHGLTPGQQYTLQGFNGTGFTGYNATYIALPGTTGSTLVGETATGGGTCPTSPLDTSAHEGTALSGTGGSITFPAPSATSPFGSGPTGITLRNNQHICGWVVEDGDDSALPGAQSIEMVDEKGNAIPGSPALVTIPNQGTANFTGYTVTTPQSVAFNVVSISGTTMTLQSSVTIPAGATLGGSSVINFAGATVPTAQTGTSITITNPGSVSYSGLTGANAFVPALTVTAMNPYTGLGSWAAYSSGTGKVTFSAATNPGFAIGSQFTVSGMSPSGFNQTYAVTALSGSGPYLVTGNPLSGPGGIPQANNPGASTGSGGALVSVIFPGMTILGAAPNPSYVLPYGTYGATGAGGVGTYALSSNQTAALGSSGSPVTIFAFSSFYDTAATSGNPAGGTVTRYTPSSIGDFIPELGGGNLTLTGSARTGWGGSLGNFATLYGVLPTQSGGAPSVSDLASICTKQIDIQAYAAAKSLKVNSLYRLNDLGIWGDSGNATVTGYITNAGGSAATLNIVSTPFGSLALPSGTQTGYLTGVGLPVASPVTIPLTTSAASTYAITPNTTAALGSSGSPVTFAVGAFKPALPIQSNTVKGYIDTTAGVSILHVTSLDDGASHSGFASFTGSLNTGFTASIAPGTGSNGAAVGQGLLTVSAPTSGSVPAVLGVGTILTAAPGGTALTAGTAIVSQLTTTAAGGVALGVAGTYVVNNSQTVASEAMLGSCASPAPGCLPGAPTQLTVSGVTGTLQAGMIVGDGGASLTGSPLLITGGSGTSWTVGGNYYPSISGDATMFATLTTVVPGEYIQNSTATNPILNPVKVLAYSGACGISGAFNGGPGCYTLSGSPNSANAVASSSSPVVFAGTTITDGGVIAPGPALHIDDKGPGIIFPANHSTGVGSLVLSGTYDTPTLGGTPSGIQALVSNSANGPALSGCTPCNWGALSGTIAGGVWSGTLAGVPNGGPYFVSVRATNGTAYATLQSPVRIGDVWAEWGQGQGGSMVSAQSGTYTSWFAGDWGYIKPAPATSSGTWAFLLGPPVTANFVPGQTINYSGDRFGINAGGILPSEAVIAFDQGLTNAYGNPASFLYPARDGVGIGPYTLGNASQTQTVGAGDGSSLTWCSASKFCADPSGGVQSPLVFNAASLTGGWFAGSVSGSTLSVTTRMGGAVAPGMVLSGGTGVSGSPTVVRCISNCGTGLSIDGSTWQLSSSASSGASGTTSVPLYVEPVGGAPWPNLNIQTSGSAVYGFAGFGWPLVKAGTFSLSVNGATVCQDTQIFAYNNTGGNCTGATIASSFVNYQTGDYQITFASGNAPASGATILASWTNIISPQTVSTTFDRPQGFDMFGDGGSQSGPVSSQFAKLPGGVSGHIFSGYGTDKGYMLNQAAPVPATQGYQFGGVGYSQMVSWWIGTKFPAMIPGANASVPFATTGQWRVEGPQAFTAPIDFFDGVHEQWTQDVVTKSTFSGTVASGILTLAADSVGPMWEGEIVNCASVTAGCAIGPLSGAYITALTSGAWGKSGSTYTLAGSPPNVTSAAAMQNPVLYSGAGHAFYLGALNDIIVQSTGISGTVGRAPHPSNGFTGGRRATSRWAAMIWGADPSNATPATDPKNDRVKANAAGCDSSALAAPCLDVGSTYQASATATWSGNIVTVAGGLAAHARPFVVGQAVSCSGCNSGLVITALDIPPTQSTATGAGEVGQTFHLTVRNASGQPIGGSGSGAITAGCSGTSGTGSNCIDVAIAVNVGGTFGTAASIDTCGANNLNGNAPNYSIPNGPCSGNGIGEIVRAFRVGTAQTMYGTGASSSGNPPKGSVFDDGVDIADGTFNQSAAFTANIVGAKVVQLVKAPAYSGGVLTGIGQWPSGSTYISYGDLTIVSGRMGSLLGYVGGQSFPFTGGSGYTNGTQTIAATCATIQSPGTAPRFDVTVAGGAIVNVVPSAATSGNQPVGLGIGSTCTVPLTTLGAGTGGVIPAIPVAPLEGTGGIGTYNTDSNTVGMFLYDNSGEPGNPLNQFFTNGMGGYFEPGLPLRPFGLFQGAVVSG